MAKPRSGLSEIIRKADSCLYKSKSALSVDTCTSGSVGAMRRVSFGREEIGTEMKNIFGSNKSGAQEKTRSKIFGCSPPVRAGNPLIKNEQFFINKASLVEKSLAAGQIDSKVFALSPPSS